MEDYNIKNNSLEYFIKVLSLFFYGIILIVLDLMLLAFIGGDLKGIPHIVLIDISIGLIASSILHCTKGSFKKVLFIIDNILITLYALFIFIEIYLKIAFNTFYPIRTIVYNLKSVLIEYKDEIFHIVTSRATLLLLFIAILLIIILIGKSLYFNKSSNVYIPRILVVVIPVAAFLFFLSIASVTETNPAFSVNIVKYGLKMAGYNEIKNRESASLILHNSDLSNNEREEHEDKEVNNVLDFDFDAIMNNEKRKDFNAINKYVSSLTPTKKNKYTGIFKGKNLIMICAEAFNSVIVNEDLFPCLYRLINNGFKFNNFYQPKGASSTSAGEYSFMTGIVPIYNDYTFSMTIGNNMEFTVPYMLKNEGYATYSFHNGISSYYSRDDTHGDFMGFDSFMANDTGLNDLAGYYPDDTKLLDSTFEIIAKDKPFYAYYMTYTGHMPYAGATGIYIQDKYKKVKDYYGSKYSEVIETYIAKNIFLEEGLEKLLNHLEQNNMLNDTVICIAPDHYPYGLYNANAYTGEKTNYVAELFNDPRIEEHIMERDRTDLILWSGCLEEEYKDLVVPVDKYCSTIDVTPTLLNLFGLPFDSRIYPGHDIFSDIEGIVVYQDGRYITESERRTYNSKVDNNLNVYLINRVNNIINYCTFFIKNDYYGYLTGEKGIEKKICYLTFDGGPSIYTDKIVKILDEYDVPAAFFVVGTENLTYLPILLENGHRVYPLADNYDFLDLYKDDQKFLNSLIALKNKIQAYTGFTPNLMRFPGGSGNEFANSVNEGVMSRLTHMVPSLGFIYVDWNVDSGDAELSYTVDDIVNNVLSGADKENIICVLMHDLGINEKTLEALPLIIEKLKGRGYKFKVLDQHSKIFHQVVAN